MIEGAVANLIDFGAVYDGNTAQTDQASVIQSVIDAGYKHINIGNEGVLYLASTITTPDNTPDEPIHITSSGATIQTGGNTRIFDIGQNTKIDGLIFVGSGETSGDTSENFVYVSGNGLDNVRNSTFLGCGGTAVIIRQYYTVHEGSRIIGNTIKQCKVGIDLQERGEYCTVSQNTIVANGTGIIIAGGNNRVVDNTITDNDLGVLVTSGANDAHGQVGNNAINHNTINLQVDAISVDEMFFGGNLFYAGKIVLNGCTGVTFNGGVIDETCLIEQIGCTNCWATGVRMSGATAINTTPNMTSPSELVFVDPVFDAGVSVTSPSSMGTSYVKARRTGSTTVSPASFTDLVFNNDNTNAIPANASYTVRDFFDVSTNEFQAKSQFLHRSFTVDFHALITVSHPSLPVAATDAAAEIVDADDTTNVLGVFTVSREKTLASGRKARVLSFSGTLERKDFKIRLYNDGSSTLTIEADIADAPCFGELIGV
jgi:parallel beta-helix repeat protein